MQKSLELVVSLLISNGNAKKGEKIAKYKCSQMKSMQKKDDVVIILWYKAAICFQEAKVVSEFCFSSLVCVNK